MSQIDNKKLLVLGAGLVALPCIESAVRRKYHVTVVSLVEEELKRVSSKLPVVKTELVDISSNQQRLSELVAQHDAVASLVSDSMHAAIAEHCIHHKKPMVTASNVLDNLKALDQRARDAGVVILAECGLDPGLDHMLSMSQIDAIKKDGGKIQSFSSSCGGLPPLRFAEEPLKYKFSWYPLGAMQSCLRPATFLKEGQVIKIASGHIYDEVNNIDDLMDGSTQFENIPNGEALRFQKLYDIPSATGFYRGTIRYKGFSSIMKTLIHLGLLSTETFPSLSDSAPDISWREVISLLLKLPAKSSLNDVIKAWLDVRTEDLVSLEIIFNLLSENDLAPKAPSLLHSLTTYLAKKLSYGPQETDLVVMRNEIEYVQSNGKQQRVKIDLVEEGQVDGASAMARTVGLTVTAAASLLLDGGLQKTGVIIPVYEEIYKPVLDQIRMEGIQIKTSIVDV